MIALLYKEINTFLSSLMGYVVMLVFLLSIGLVIWVFPNNILENGYANIDQLFIIAPWIFSFLAPAITMRTFSEEYKNGTLELLLTSPISDWHIILAKFLTGFLIILFTIIPTIVYFYTVYQLAVPIGNVDTGAMWGSYIGLLLLGAGFISVGVFSSSITKNQIIAFILGVFICFFMFFGIEQIAKFKMFQSIQGILIQFSMFEHYISISRGVVDSRDIVYFLCFIFFFLLLTKTKLESRKW